MFGYVKNIKEKNIPKFYPECILCFRELCRRVKVKGDYIDIIWNKVKFYHKSLGKTGILGTNVMLEESMINRNLLTKLAFILKLINRNLYYPQNERNGQ